MFVRVCFVIAATFVFTLPLSLSAQSAPSEFYGADGGSCLDDFSRCNRLCDFKFPTGNSQECKAGCTSQRQQCCSDGTDACSTACRLLHTSGCEGRCAQYHQQCLGNGSSGGSPGDGGDPWIPSPKPNLPGEPPRQILPLSNKPLPPSFLDELKLALCQCVIADELVVTPHGAGVQWNGKKGYVIVGVGGCLQDQRMFCQIGFSF
jgi:hypothetical protein